MRFAPDGDMIETLTPDRSDQPFGKAVLPGRGRCHCRTRYTVGGKRRIGRCCCGMRDLCRLIGWMVVDLIRSREALEAEIWVLRQQINVLRRTAPKKLSFSAIDRLIFVGLYRLFP